MSQLIPEAAAVLDACLLPVDQDWTALKAAAEAYRAKMQPAKPPTEAAPKFPKTYCSNCGREFGPGEHGFSHCDQHANL